MQDWARNNKERLPKLWQKKMQDWAINHIKNGAKLGTKFTWKKDAILGESATWKIGAKLGESGAKLDSIQHMALNRELIF